MQGPLLDHWTGIPSGRRLTKRCSKAKAHCATDRLSPVTVRPLTRFVAHIPASEATPLSLLRNGSMIAERDGNSPTPPKACSENLKCPQEGRHHPSFNRAAATTHPRHRPWTIYISQHQSDHESLAPEPIY